MYFPPNTQALAHRAAGWICVKHRMSRLDSRWLMISGSLQRLRATLCCVAVWFRYRMWGSKKSADAFNITMRHCHGDGSIVTFLHVLVHLPCMPVSNIFCNFRPSYSIIPHSLHFSQTAHLSLIPVSHLVPCQSVWWTIMAFQPLTMFDCLLSV